MIHTNIYTIALPELCTDNWYSIYNCAVFTTLIPNEQFVSQLPNASMSARDLGIVYHNEAFRIATNKKISPFLRVYPLIVTF